jgi:hypothetical protein
VSIKSLSLEIARIAIIRPWFDPSFVISPSWMWATAEQALLFAGKTPPSGRMPAYTTEVVFVKDITINYDEFQKDESGYK